MNTERLNNWVQTTTGIAIVIGLVLVIWELRQNREATQSQLTSEYWSMSSQMQATVMGEDAAIALAKACDNPQSLTKADLVILDHYYLALINRMDRLASLQDRGSFYSDYQVSDESIYLYVLMESTAGRAHLKTAPLKRFRPIIDKRLAEWDGQDCAFLNAWEANIKIESK